MSQTAPVIEVRGLSFAYGAARVLSGVSFAVSEGERVSVIGPNGAGKSTLLKLLNRILTGARGAILIKGRPIKKYSQKQIAGIIGYVPQPDGLYFPYTAMEFVMMGRYPHLSPFTSIGAGDMTAAREAMALAGVERFAARHVMSLSGGERQRVFMAAALAQGAHVLLLDEPATFLDPKSADEILRTLARINREKGVTIVSVTHDINTAALTSGRIIALRGGAVGFDGAPAGLMNNETLSLIYGKEFLFVTHPQTGARVIAPEVFA